MKAFTSTLLCSYFVCLLLLQANNTQTIKISIKNKCEQAFTYTILSETRDTIYQKTTNDNLVIKHNTPKNVITRFYINEERFVILPIKQTQISIDCADSLVVSFKNKDNKIYNKARRNRWKTNATYMEYVYQLLGDTTLSEKQKMELENKIATLDDKKNQDEFNIFYQAAPSLASLHYLHEIVSNQNETKDREDKIYATFADAPHLQQNELFVEATRLRNLPRYNENDTIKELAFTDQFKMTFDTTNYLIYYVSEHCHFCQEEFDIVAKAKSLVSPAIKVIIFDDSNYDKYQNVCKQKNWQYVYDKDLRNHDTAFSLGALGTPYGLYISKNKIMKKRFRFERDKDLIR